MAMSGSMIGPQTWWSEYGTYKRHKFSWSATISGYTATINWSVVCEGNDTQSVNQHCNLRLVAGGSEIYNKKSKRTVWQNWSSTGEGYSGWTLLSGSFTLSASYNTGAFPSFTAELQSAIYQGAYQGGTASESFSIDSKTITPPAISSIIDNGNNTITVNFSKGNLTGGTLYLYLAANRSYNPSTDKYDCYKSFSTTNDSYNVSLGDISNISSSSGKKTKNTIKAKIYRYNSDYLKSGSAGSGDVYFYKAPSDPGKPYIDSSTNKYGKDKLTVSSKITFKWNKPSTGCDGYRIRVRINNVGQNVYNASGAYVGSYYDVSGESKNSFVLDCNKYSLKSGDYVSINVYAYTETGAGGWLWSGGGNTAVFSDNHYLAADNNYIMHVKTKNNMPSKDGTWMKAEVVNLRESLKPGSAWYEASFIYGRGVLPWK